MGQQAHQQHHRRMEQIHHEQPDQPPGDGKTQADIAAQIEGLVGVIPPALMEELLQHKSGRQLQQGGQQHRPQKEQQQVLLERLQAEENNGRAEAVNGTHRPVEESPVDEFPRHQGRIAHLGTPAQQRINKENP